MWRMWRKKCHDQYIAFVHQKDQRREERTWCASSSSKHLRSPPSRAAANRFNPVHRKVETSPKGARETRKVYIFIYILYIYVHSLARIRGPHYTRTKLCQHLFDLKSKSWIHACFLSDQVIPIACIWIQSDLVSWCHWNVESHWSQQRNLLRFRPTEANSKRFCSGQFFQWNKLQ